MNVDFDKRAGAGKDISSCDNGGRGMYFSFLGDAHFYEVKKDSGAFVS